MSFASFASGSNEVVATSIAASIAELIISAIEDERDREQQRDQLELRRRRGRARATSTTTAASEVDPHVPLRAEHVDDPLERVVEALDQRERRRPAGRSAPAAAVSAQSLPERRPSDVHPAYASSRPPSPARGRSRAGGGGRARAARARRRRPPAGQSTTSPSWRGDPAGSAARGRRSGTRARRSPRRRRGGRASGSRISSGADELRCRARRPRRPRRRAPGGRARPRRPPRPRPRCGSRPRPRSPAALRARLLGVQPVRLDDPLDELVPDDVLVAEADERDPVDRAEDVLRRVIRPDACSRGRSICVTSPVTTTFEPKPSRVRNICICSGSCSAPRRG